MGIYDREYIRDDAARSRPARTRIPGLRTWSVNTWLIVITVAVFVIDSFLPLRIMPVSAPVLFDGVTAVPRSAVRVGKPQVYRFPQTDPSGRTVLATGYGQPLLAAPGGVQIGWQEVRQMHFLESLLHFSTQRGFLQVEFWRLIGFQFLHSHQTIAHLLFNMIGLFFFGPMVEQYLGGKRYLAFYLLCGIFGGLMYVLLNLGGLLAGMVFGLSGSIPGLLFNDVYTPLIGASAGVFGVLMAGAFLAPSATVLVFFILPMRLATLAYVLVAMALLTVFFGGENAGGEAGHLGGAIAGFYLIRHPRHLHGFFDVLGWMDPTSHHYRRKSVSWGRGAAPPPVTRRSTASSTRSTRAA